MDINKIRDMREMSVRKSNLFIQKARYSLSARQFDIINYIISKIKPDDKGNELYTISIMELCQVCGINPRNTYTAIKREIDEIDKLRLWIPIDDKEVRIQWFHRLRMCRGSGTIELSFNEDLQPFFFEVRKGFTQYPACYSFALRSKYSKYLYDYIKSKEFRRQWAVDIEYFCKYICPNEYTEFKSIKQRILEVAVAEINELTDIRVSYEAVKQNSRKTTHIFFTVERVEDEEEVEERRFNRVKALPITVFPQDDIYSSPKQPKYIKQDDLPY